MVIKTKIFAVAVFLAPFITYFFYLREVDKYTYICSALGNTDYPAIIFLFVLYFLFMPIYLWLCYAHDQTMWYICCSICVLWELQIAVAALDHSMDNPRRGGEFGWLKWVHFFTTFLVLVGGAVQLDYGMIPDRKSWQRVLPYVGVCLYVAVFVAVKTLFPPSDQLGQAIAVTAELFGFIVLLGRLIFFRFVTSAWYSPTRRVRQAKIYEIPLHEMDSVVLDERVL